MRQRLELLDAQSDTTLCTELDLPTSEHTGDPLALLGRRVLRQAAARTIRRLLIMRNARCAESIQPRPVAGESANEVTSHNTAQHAVIEAGDQ
jgi:hypothetical protein